MYSKKTVFNSLKSQSKNKKRGTFPVFPHPAIISPWMLSVFRNACCSLEEALPLWTI